MGKNKLYNLQKCKCNKCRWFFVCFFSPKKWEMCWSGCQTKSNKVKFRHFVGEEIRSRQNPILVGILHQCGIKTVWLPVKPWRYISIYSFIYNKSHENTKTNNKVTHQTLQLTAWVPLKTQQWANEHCCCCCWLFSCLCNTKQNGGNKLKTWDWIRKTTFLDKPGTIFKWMIL